MLPVKAYVSPKGFRVRQEPGGSTWIEYQPSEVRGPAVFFIIWVVLVSIACMGSTHEVYRKYNSLASFTRYLTSVSWLGWLVVIAIAILMIGLPAVVLSWFLFGKSRFELSRNGLSIQKTLFFWHRTRFVPRDEMLRFTQVKDGGSRGENGWPEDDSFPTWGLILNAKQDEKVKRKQLATMSRWPKMINYLEHLSAMGADDQGDLPGTALSRLVTEQEISLLSREPIDKSDWLGMVLSEWYELTFVPSRARE